MEVSGLVFVLLDWFDFGDASLEIFLEGGRGHMFEFFHLAFDASLQHPLPLLGVDISDLLHSHDAHLLNHNGGMC